MTGLLSNFLPAMIAVSVLVVVGACLALVVGRRSAAGSRTVARALSVVSLVAILVATLSPRSWPPQRDGWGDLVLPPGGDTLGRLDVLSTDPSSLAAVLVVLNVVLFVPFAAFGVLGWGRPLAVLLVALAVSIGIETVQLVALSRVAATDDVVLNMAGALIGTAIGMLADLVGRGYAGRPRAADDRRSAVHHGAE